MRKNETNATSEKHFCNCAVTGCPRHPANHDQGCDPCIKFNLEKGQIPRCMFSAINENVSPKDLSYGGFVKFYQDHN